MLWSLGGLLLKLVDWHPLAVAGGRELIAGVFLLVWVRRPKFTWSATQIGAAVAYAACTVLFAVANKFTTAANAIFLQYTAPIYIALLSFWIDHRRREAHRQRGPHGLALLRGAVGAGRPVGR
jgi:drug/metabolite transporter (DMT)-like permease